MTWRRCAAGCAPWSATASSSSTARAITASRKKWIWCAAAWWVIPTVSVSSSPTRAATICSSRPSRCAACCMATVLWPACWASIAAAAHQIHFLREAVIALAVDDELAVALHGAQPAAQRLQVILAAEAQRSGNLLERGGLAMLGKVLQDEFAAGNGLGVFLRFAVVKRVCYGTAFRHDVFLILL